MKPRGAHHLITESARLLVSREWTEIELILGQYSIRTSSDDYGNAYEYIIAMAKNSADEELRELHSFHVVESQDSPTDVQTWARGGLSCMLAISQTLGQHWTNGIWAVSARHQPIYCAHTSISRPRNGWMAATETALRTRDAMVVFLHEGFRDNNGAIRRLALRWLDASRFCCRIDVLPYGFMSDFQAFMGKDATPPASVTHSAIGDRP